MVKLPEAKKGFVLLPRRWVVERFFGWASQFRRVARDYERLPDAPARSLDTPTPEAAQLQALVRHLETLQEIRQMEQNRLDVTETAPVRASLEAILIVFDQQIEQIKKLFEDHIDGSPTLRVQRELLTSIPGIGPTTAAVLLSEIGDVSLFAGSRQVAAFAGRVLRIRQSCQWKGHVRLSKCGSGPSSQSAVHAGGSLAALQSSDPGASASSSLIRQEQDVGVGCGHAQVADAGLWCAEVGPALRPELCH